MIKTIQFIIFYIIINLFGFVIMYIDKRKAINNTYRISEKFIMVISLIFGSLGVYIGMYTFRHKTKHLKFTIGIPILLILNIFCIVYMLKLGIII